MARANIAVGLAKGHAVTKREKTVRQASRKGVSGWLRAAGVGFSTGLCNTVPAACSSHRAARAALERLPAQQGLPAQRILGD